MVLFFMELVFRGTCFRVGLLVLPLCGAAVTFLAVDQSWRFSAYSGPVQRK